MKKTLHQLIVKTSWAKVEHHLKEDYPDEELDFYKELYWKLYNMTPTPNPDEMELHLDLLEELDDEDVMEEDLYYEIDSFNEVDDATWSLYLGFYIHPDTLKKATEAQIICHLLFELLYGDIDDYMN